MNAVDRDVFGSQEIAYECLADTERTENFKKAINEVVGPETTVLEMGTGTGILSLFAAKAGAKNIDAYEISIPMAKIAQKNVEDNNLQHVVSIHTDDVTLVGASSKQYDLLIAELVSVALIEEQLVPAFNNVLAGGYLKSTAIAMPAAQKTFVEIVDTSFDHFGVTMQTIQIEQTWQESKLRQKLSEPMLISDVDFNQAIATNTPIEPLVSKVIKFTPTANGTVNAIRLTSDSWLSSTVVSGWTQCMNSPAIIPIESITVNQGEALKLRISYEMGGEMKSVKVERV